MLISTSQHPVQCQARGKHWVIILSNKQNSKWLKDKTDGVLPLWEERQPTHTGLSALAAPTIPFPPLTGSPTQSDLLPAQAALWDCPCSRGLQSHIGLRPAPAVTRGGKLAYQAAQTGLGI